MTTADDAYPVLLRDLDAASRAIDAESLDTAARLAAEVESRLPLVGDPHVARSIRGTLGGIMIDLGSRTGREESVARGTQLCEEALAGVPDETIMVEELYNVANGYSSMWQLRRRNSIKTGRLDESYIKAKKYYRRATLTDPLGDRPTLSVRLQLYTNYANLLDSVGRSVEALAYYDRSLAMAPGMGEALGNKGLTLYFMSRTAGTHRHRLVLEAERLLGAAIATPLDPWILRKFDAYHREIRTAISAHQSIEPEKATTVQQISPFHAFMLTFCAEHQLFLTPASFVRGDHQAYGDPMFISGMVAPVNDDKKFDRFVTFLNQIKLDYVLARYLLVQS